MSQVFRTLSILVVGGALTVSSAWAEPVSDSFEIDPSWQPDSLGTPPRPGDVGATLPEYGEDRHGALAQDMAALSGVLGGTVLPLTMTMVKWSEVFDERTSILENVHRNEAADLLLTYGRTSAFVSPLVSWAGFMAGGGFRQKPVMALLCGIGASAIAYPLGSYLGRAIAEPITSIADGQQPMFPDRKVFAASLVWNGVITTATIAGVAIGGGETVRRPRDYGYALNLVPHEDGWIWMPSVRGSF